MWTEFADHSRRDVQALQAETGASAERPADRVDKKSGAAPPAQGNLSNCRTNGRRRLGNWHGLAKRPPDCGRGVMLLTEAFGGMSSGTLTG